MSRILVTGSADGLGRSAAEALLDVGHDVVVHARSERRARDLADLVDRGAQAVVGDLGDRDAVRDLGVELAAGPALDVVVHNAGVLRGTPVVPVNVVAPYLLTAALASPTRLVYLSSSMHLSGRPDLADVDWDGAAAGDYSTSKLLVTALAAAVARLRPEVVTSAVDPGWVPTKMGGPGASDDLVQGHETQVWLAGSDDAAALETGGYWYHRRRREPHAAVRDEVYQDRLLATLAEQTGVELH
jgi:NAD(P)-dependent dehydrogenase (short-subunit alcohol dehydrogenase family)